MESSARLELSARSTKNKKLAEVLARRDEFVGVIDDFAGRAEHKEFRGPAGDGEGGDIAVAVRVRPLLPYEEEAGYFGAVRAANPKVHAFEPRVGVKGDARPVRSDFRVDLAFGPEHGNDDVYGAVALDLVDLGLKGGVCTVLAYGQTGSGKTHTISGILERIAADLFERQRLNAQLVGEGGQSNLKLFLSFYEMLGNDVCDLLDGTRSKIDILEDKFGAINAKGATEVEIRDAVHFAELTAKALSHRRTQTTFKNDESSRSHAICSVRVENTVLKEVEDGRIFVVDLAGSESTADSQFHDPALVKETRLINKSLMSLKDCIRNRALSAVNMDKYYHIPYRLSKLTLLLKDAFELESRRHCKTVVIACVSPSVADSSMTLNTLRYAVPIRIGTVSREKAEPNPDNPATWSNAELKSWVKEASRNAIDPEVLCPFESGKQILRIPETEFIGRVMKANPSIGEKRAKAFYVKLWKLLIDARTAERKTKLKKKQKHFGNTDKEAEEWLKEMKENENSEINQQRAQEWEQKSKLGGKSAVLSVRM